MSIGNGAPRRSRPSGCRERGRSKEKNSAYGERGPPPPPPPHRPPHASRRGGMTVPFLTARAESAGAGLLPPRGRPLLPGERFFEEPAGAVDPCRGGRRRPAARFERGLSSARPSSSTRGRHDALSRLALRLGAATTIRLGELTTLRIDRYLVDRGGTLSLGEGAMLLEPTRRRAAESFMLRGAFGLIAVRGTRVFAGAERRPHRVFVARGHHRTSGAFTVALEPESSRGATLPRRPRRWSPERIAAALVRVSERRACTAASRAPISCPRRRYLDAVFAEVAPGEARPFSRPVRAALRGRRDAVSRRAARRLLLIFEEAASKPLDPLRGRCASSRCGTPPALGPTCSGEIAPLDGGPPNRHRRRLWTPSLRLRLGPAGSLSDLMARFPSSRSAWCAGSAPGSVYGRPSSRPSRCTSW